MLRRLVGGETIPEGEKLRRRKKKRGAA